MADRHLCISPACQRHKDCISRQKIRVYLPLWFTHSDETARIPPKGKKWMNSFVSLSSLPATCRTFRYRQQRLVSMQCYCVPGTTSWVSPWAAVEVRKHVSLSHQKGVPRHTQHIEPSFIHTLSLHCSGCFPSFPSPFFTLKALSHTKSHQWFW